MSLLDSVEGAPQLTGDSTSRMLFARYVQPDRMDEFSFAFEGSLEEVTPIRGTVNETPDLEGGFVQGTGRGARTYSVEMIFSGVSHDLDASTAYDILLKPGHGFLHHPLYGVKRVAVVGDIQRTVDTVDDVLCTKITVPFTETLPDAYPAAGDATEGEIALFFNASIGKLSSAFTNNWDASKIENGLSAIDQLRKEMRNIQRTINKATVGIQDLESETLRNDTILGLGIDAIIVAPTLLFTSLYWAVTAPTRSLDRSLLKVQVYADQFLFVLGLFNDMLGNIYDDSSLDRDTTKQKNKFLMQGAIVGISFTAMAAGIKAHDFKSQADARAAVADFLEGYRLAVAWKDTMEALEDYGMAGVYDWTSLSHLVETAAGTVIRDAFDLVNQRDLTLESPATILNMAWDMYGERDDKIDEIIALNNLSASDILLLDKGKVLKYIGI
jgi:hypothetical protein